MTQPIALVSDFDGTISDDDFFNYIVRQYLDDKALEPWRGYLAGTKKHFDALAEIFAKLRVPEAEFNRFIDKIKLDDTFWELADFCVRQNILVYICSAGCDYYIRRRLKNNIERFNIKVISNSGTYDEKTGLVIKPAHDYYDEELGVSKADVVKDLRQQGFFVVYCGDGAPDINAARLAGKVFARSRLFELCNQEGIAADRLENFVTVKQFIEEKIR